MSNQKQPLNYVIGSKNVFMNTELILYEMTNNGKREFNLEILMEMK